MPVEVKVKVWKDKDGKKWLQISVPYNYLDAVFKGSSRETESSKISPPSSQSHGVETRKEEPWYRFEIVCKKCGYKTWFAGTKRSLNYWKCGCGSTEFDILKEERL